MVTGWLLLLVTMTIIIISFKLFGSIKGSKPTEE